MKMMVRSIVCPVLFIIHYEILFLYSISVFFFHIDLNKLCYDFTCIHSGICTSNENDGPKCECIETAYIGERCDKCK